MAVLTILMLCCLGRVEAHLADSCPSVVQNIDIYTRRGSSGSSSQWSGMMYFWTATYSHGGVQGTSLQAYGSGCYRKNHRKLYFRANTDGVNYPKCDGGDGDTSVKFETGDKTSWATALTSHNSDMPSERPHCNTNINFMKFWHLVGKGFQLPDYYTKTGTPCNTDAAPNSCNEKLAVSMCFSGFMCEATQVQVGGTFLF